MDTWLETWWRITPAAMVTMVMGCRALAVFEYGNSGEEEVQRSTLGALAPYVCSREVEGVKVFLCHEYFALHIGLPTINVC